MKISIRKGLGFGLTSGIITTLGLMVGLSSGTKSKAIVLGGIAVIAIADALSDAMGMHISEESGHKDIPKREVWESTIATFFFKFIFALTFVIPVLLFNLSLAIWVSVGWGISLLAVFSFYIAKKQEGHPGKAVFEHLFIAFVVIIATHFAGKWVSGIFS